MAVTYYQELAENEYRNRVANWHNTCKWYQPLNRDMNDRHASSYFIGAPSVDRISEAVLGQRKSNDESYNKLKKTVRERFIALHIERGAHSKGYGQSRGI